MTKGAYPINRLHQQMDRLFEDFFGPETQRWVLGGPVRNFPPLAVWEDADTYHVEAELPGLAIDDIDLFVKDRQLTIAGKLGTQQPTEGQTVHRQERPTGEFRRDLTLPMAVDTERVEAMLNDGVLTLRLPKHESAKGRKISVRAGASN